MSCVENGIGLQLEIGSSGSSVSLTLNRLPLEGNCLSERAKSNLPFGINKCPNFRKPARLTVDRTSQGRSHSFH
jgi:hypothetical protein